MIREIHKNYIKAGSDIVLTNTFGANALKFHAEGCSLEQTVKTAVRLVKEAAKKAGAAPAETSGTAMANAPYTQRSISGLPENC